MDVKIEQPGALHVVITPTEADVRHFARLATRRLRRMFLVLGGLMWLAAYLCLYDGDGPPFLAGLITGMIGTSLLASAAVLPRGVGRRLPSFMRETRTCDIDEHGIRLAGSAWQTAYSWAAFHEARLVKHLVLLNRAPGAQGLALPRSAFSSEQEARFVAILTERTLIKAG